MTKHKIIGVSGVLLLIVIGAIYLYIRETANSAWQQKVPPTVVSVTPVKQQNWQNVIQATGSLVAKQGIVVEAEAAGRVTKIYFHSGEQVKTGQPLVQLNPAILKAQLAYDRAQYHLSRSNFQRIKMLYQQKVASQATLDTSQATMDSASANVDQTRAELAQLLIRAPFSGKLGLRQMSLGDFLAAGTPIANLQSMDPMYVDFSIPQIYLTDLTNGETVTIDSQSYPKQHFTGKVIAFDSVINPDTRSIEVRASIPNKDGKLIPGTFVEVNLFVGKAKPILTVPLPAIVYSPEGDSIYAFMKNKSISIPVKLGQQRGNEVAITANLKPKQLIITAGQMKIFNGAPVMTQAQEQQMLSKMKSKKAHETH